MGVCGQDHRSATLPHRNNPVPIVQGDWVGPRSRSGQVRWKNYKPLKMDCAPRG
jgi:hypothetical protein